jgi:predicted metal-dependent HD superfamily phosphohydrolase
MLSTFVKLAPNRDKTPVIDALVRLRKHYAEPHRYYHTWAHLEQGYGEHTSVSDVPLSPVEFFAWAYHDAVYNPLAQDNEEKSAIVFLQDYEALGFDVDHADDVVGLIRSTELSSEPACVINDMDLCILGSSLKTYFQYVRNVRKEYPFISEDVWRSGRMEVLKIFLKRSRLGKLYVTREFSAKFTYMAERNMTAELEQLMGEAKRNSVAAV